MVDHLRGAYRVSIRRACATIRAGRTSYLYKSRRDGQATLRKRIREIAETRVRYGYRRIHVLLKREGWAVNAKRVHRLYKLEGLQMRHKPPRRRVTVKLRQDRASASGPNDIWAIDFMYDQLFDGTRIWVLTMVDQFSRLCPGLAVVRSATAMDVVDALDRAVAKYGCPRTIRVDQGSQFTARETDLWAYGKGVTLDFSRPGKPTDNSFIESFKARFRAECLNQHWFLDLDDAREKVEAWRRDYNMARPHSAIGDRPPIALLRALVACPEGSKTPASLTNTGPDPG